jgi:hypothetical protein
MADLMDHVLSMWASGFLDVKGLAARFSSGGDSVEFSLQPPERCGGMAVLRRPRPDEGCKIDGQKTIRFGVCIRAFVSGEEQDLVKSDEDLLVRALGSFFDVCVSRDESLGASSSRWDKSNVLLKSSAFMSRFCHTSYMSEDGIGTGFKTGVRLESVAISTEGSDHVISSPSFDASSLGLEGELRGYFDRAVYEAFPPRTDATSSRP